jgi:Na+-driven multidrug efflux pump
MFSLIGSGTVNVILNLVFVVGCGMSVAGVAIATIISQYVSAAYALFVLIRGKDKPYAFHPRNMTFDIGVFKRMLRLGLPAGLQSSMFSISNLMFTAAINTLSTAAISAKAIFIDILCIANAISAAYCSSSMTFAGQNYGAGKPKRIVRSFFCATAQSVTIVFTVSMIILAAIDPIASMYVAADDPMRADVIAEITATASVIMPLYFISGIMNTLSGTIRGMGVSLINMLIYVIGVSGVRIVWVLTVFKLPAFNSLAGLYTSWPVSWCTVIAGMSILYAITLGKMKKKMRNEE